jgi:hypothetical protein
MKKTILGVAACCLLMAASQANAAILTQMFIDAGTTSATIDVDELGTVTCSGDCGTLVFPGALSPHKTLLVTGTIGEFTINATGVGGLDAISPTLQNLNQIEAASKGAGTLSVQFTDTQYCGTGGGHCFGSTFVISASTVNDTGTQSSTTDFATFLDGSNSVPAGTLIHSFTGLTGLSDKASGTFSNPTNAIGGSLTTATAIHFARAGTVQANLQLSSSLGRGTGVPEPGTFALFGLATGLVFMKFRRRARD